ncbi:hypothetical protein [Novosphingobium sp. MMS21-SN21R]|uniref:hypothetical protein n=1 Tax=Novosphingobium sp. MMS21-SN21R TaxID=2969298 RepID=UPI0028843F7B|nr:hypothetical protein [Novosphingobium sp. MMS21-SN21R]MDT0508332.1 hypothetical protein [Novosphingobium sp. MMS21-SN21R]
MTLSSAACGQVALASRALPVTGSTPQVCTITEGDLQAGQLVNFNGVTGDTLQITQLVDQQSLAARGASATLTFSAVCNYPHQIRIESENNGLWPTDGRIAVDAPGFATALPYDARVTWSDRSGLLQTDALVRSSREQRISLDQAAAGTVTLRLAIAAGASNNGSNAPVLAGVYGDTLRIFLEPR